MLANLGENVGTSPEIAILLGLAAVIFVYAGFQTYRNFQIYRTLRFLGGFTKWVLALSGLVLIGGLFQATRPYQLPPSDEFAIVLGNTQNTPQPSLNADVAEFIEQSLLLHKGEEADEVLSSMAFVSATDPPTLLVVDDGPEGFVRMSTNSTRAKRDARDNIKALRRFLEQQEPNSNGASYLEAIIEASRNIGTGSTITVIGSGLSDAGDVNFAHDKLLTSQKKRQEKIQFLKEKYGGDYLAGYTVVFAGLGDTAPPQEPLSQKQKIIVREFYEEIIDALGGEFKKNTRSHVGDPISTSYTVNTTDTGCGKLNYTLGDKDLEFVSDEARFVSQSDAQRALTRVVAVYKDDPARVERITVEGYIYLTPEQRKRVGSSGEPLSKLRAQAVRTSLIDQGIPGNKIRAVGKGAGPHNNADNPGLDRMVTFEIVRTPNPDC